ncbi:unnamed protein product [Durusdinium trenchii]|uniref:Uncharacterized protein n=1 Tax=Durusdinium trenchii TaxID=1381693 RepID=A0ABP0MTA8_9DINO
MPERRIDADGGLYTYEEISSYYGKYYSLKAIRSYWKRMHKLQPEVKQTKGNNKVLRWQRKQIVPKAALETSMNSLWLICLAGPSAVGVGAVEFATKSIWIHRQCMLSRAPRPVQG